MRSFDSGPQGCYEPQTEDFGGGFAPCMGKPVGTCVQSNDFNAPCPAQLVDDGNNGNNNNNGNNGNGNDYNWLKLDYYFTDDCTGTPFLRWSRQTDATTGNCELGQVHGCQYFSGVSYTTLDCVDSVPEVCPDCHTILTGYSKENGQDIGCAGNSGNAPSENFLFYRISALENIPTSCINTTETSLRSNEYFCNETGWFANVYSTGKLKFCCFVCFFLCGLHLI